MKRHHQEQNIITKKLLEETQKESFPYFVDYGGLKIRVDKNVFSPKYFYGWKVFVENFPVFLGKSVLEVGAATGITALYLAKKGAGKVVAVDINEDAVENVKANKVLNNIDNIDMRFSDLFSGIKRGEKFDIIYWNMPFGEMEEGYVHENVLERSIFDPGYNILKRYLGEAPSYLTDDGYVLVGTGSGGNIERFKEVASDLGFDVELLAKVDSEEVEPVDFQLYKLVKF